MEANDILLERVVRDGCIMDMVVPWNTSTVDTTGNQRFVPYSEVSLTQGLPVYFWYIGVVLCNWAVEYNVATFQSFPLATFQNFPLLYVGGKG